MPSRPDQIEDDELRGSAPHGTCHGYAVGLYPRVPSSKAFPPVHYDRARQIQVYDRPWTYGDPKPFGRGHARIYVSGHAALVADLNGNDIPFPDTKRDPMIFDRLYNLDDGEHRLDHDPERIKKGIEYYAKNGRKFMVNNSHDGYCAYQRWKFATASNYEAQVAVVMKSVLLGIYESLMNKYQKFGACENLWQSWIKVFCRKGRHRGPVIGYVAWLWCRLHGLTVEVVHMTLFRGVCIKKEYNWRRSQHQYEYDNRGPCGCHLGPGLCRIVEARTRADFVAYFQEAQDIADAIFLKTIREFDEA